MQQEGPLQRALNVADLSLELDLSEEAMETVLSYLQVGVATDCLNAFEC